MIEIDKLIDAEELLLCMTMKCAFKVLFIERPRARNFCRSMIDL